MEAKEGKGIKEDGVHNGTYLDDMIDLIDVLIGSHNYHLSVIENNEDKIDTGNNEQDVIVIFLKDEHYTVGLLSRKRHEVLYFDPYGNGADLDEEEKNYIIQRRIDDIQQLQEASMRYSPQEMMRLKVNDA